VEHRDDLASKTALMTPWHIREHIPQQVDRTALLARLRQRLAGGRPETGMVIGDDEAHARQPTLDQFGEQAGPARFGLLGANVDTQQSSVAVRTDAATRAETFSTVLAQRASMNVASR
jgi:hypothetical protein